MAAFFSSRRKEPKEVALSLKESAKE